MGKASSHDTIIRKARALLSSLGLACLLISLTGCDADNEYDTSHVCYFTFDTTIHNTSILLNALNPLSPGVFVSVSNQPRNGVHCIVAQLNDGVTNEETAITTARENYSSYVLGANNGLIIGYSSLGNGLYAYDRQCPNCMETYNLYKYPLGWTNNGQWIQCGNCKRKYDLNNSGFVVDGETGLKLIRYKVFYDGGILTVRN